MKLFEIEPRLTTKVNPEGMTVIRLTAMPNFLGNFKWLMGIINQKYYLCKIETPDQTTIEMFPNAGHYIHQVGIVIDIVFSITKEYDKESDWSIEKLLENENPDGFLSKVTFRSSISDDIATTFVQLVFQTLMNRKLKDLYEGLSNLFRQWVKTRLYDIDRSLQKKAIRINRPFSSSKKKLELQSNIQKVKSFLARWQCLEEKYEQWKGQVKALIHQETPSSDSLIAGVKLMKTIQDISDECDILSQEISNFKI